MSGGGSGGGGLIPMMLSRKVASICKSSIYFPCILNVNFSLSFILDLGNAVPRF